MPQDRTDIPVGESIDVRLRAGVVVTNAPLVVQIGGETVTVPAGGAGVVDIEVVSPADWPPVPGDVWIDKDGLVWFAYQFNDNGTLKTRMMPVNGGTPQAPAAIKATHRPWDLVYRAA